jgi:predicted nucleotidyltransferase component of viral defense system
MLAGVSSLPEASRYSTDMLAVTRVQSFCYVNLIETSTLVSVRDLNDLYYIEQRESESERLLYTSRKWQDGFHNGSNMGPQRSILHNTQ